MPLTTIAALTVTMLGTAFLSGIFGMAGGLILMGVLLAILPLPDAMALHAVTQITSNGWRGVLWLRYVRWNAMTWYLLGSLVAFVAWSFFQVVPSKAVSLILLGGCPLLVRLFPASLKPNPERITHGLAYGGMSMVLILLAGVSGPLIDSYFLGGKLQRREIVATKAACQVLTHSAKLLYFGTMLSQGASVDLRMAALAITASIIGTSAARPVLDRMTDTQYRTWATHMITAISVFYLVQGSYLAVT